MAALDALTSNLLPDRDDAAFLQDVGIIPSSSSSTTTNPYTTGGSPTNLQTGTSSSDVLQAIQRLDEKVTGGFAQIMAKLSNTPIRGGGSRINSKQPIEMSAGNSGAATQPSMLNKAKELFGFGPAAAPAASNAATAPAAAPALVGSTPNKSKLMSTGSTSQTTQMASTSSLSGGRRRRRSRTRKSRQKRSRHSRRRN